LAAQTQRAGGDERQERSHFSPQFVISTFRNGKGAYQNYELDQSVLERSESGSLALVVRFHTAGRGTKCVDVGYSVIAKAGGSPLDPKIARSRNAHAISP
jgi:hypothetical protein